MIPHLLTEIALIVILIRAVYMTFQLVSSSRKQWLEIAYNAAIAVFVLSFLV